MARGISGWFPGASDERREIRLGIPNEAKILEHARTVVLGALDQLLELREEALLNTVRYVIPTFQDDDIRISMDEDDETMELEPEMKGMRSASDDDLFGTFAFPITPDIDVELHRQETSEAALGDIEADKEGSGASRPKKVEASEKWEEALASEVSKIKKDKAGTFALMMEGTVHHLETAYLDADRPSYLNHKEASSDPAATTDPIESREVPGFGYALYEDNVWAISVSTT